MSQPGKIRRVRLFGNFLILASGVLMLSIGCGRREQSTAELDDLDRIPPPKSNRITDSSTKTPPLNPGNPVSNKTILPGASNVPGEAIFIVDFMGAKGKGNRFCIIADSSLSMRAGIKIRDPKARKKWKRLTRLDFLKKELLKTLRELKTGARFNVILFDRDPHLLTGMKWLRGGADVEELVPKIQNIKLYLATVPYPAFEKAFQLDPQPDVIFFMTDGYFKNTTHAKIAELNGREPKTVIHTIQLSSPPSRKQIAREKKLKKQKVLLQLNRYLAKAYGGAGKIPMELQPWLNDVRNKMRTEKVLYRAILAEAQMRIIAQQSGGTFREILVAADGPHS